MAQATYAGKGDTVDFVTGIALAEGQVVVLAGTNGRIVGVVADAVPINGVATLYLQGTFEFPKASADNIAIGEKVYWHLVNNNVQLSATGAVLLGTAVESKGASTTTIKVRIPLHGL